MATNTAASFTNHTGNGTAGPFSISFSYLSEAEDDVTVGGVLKTITTHYTFTSATQITFTSGNEPANGAVIKFQRDTNVGSKKVDFVDGSVLTESDLDTQNDQLLFAVQEITDNFVKKDGSQVVTGNLVFEGSVDDTNETTLAITNPTADRTITLPDTTGTVVTTGDTGTVTSTMINNGTIVNADVNANAAIAGTKISPNFGSQNIVTSGTIDGRDVSTDGTKLDGIESGATADQTAAEIRTLVESATDSNVFTDADHSKLNAIEASATADQTASEIRSLVESATDSNVFTDADHTKLNNIEASATADQTGAEIKSLYEGESDTNAFTDAEKTKLGNLGSLNALSDVNTSGVADGKILKYDASASEFIIADDGGSGGGGSSTFTGLSDTPANFGSAANKTVKVNSAGNALEFVTVPTPNTDLDQDSSPQLAANLDVQTNEITTSTTNGNVKLTPDGTGKVEIKGNGSNDAQVVLNCSNNSHGQTIKAPPHSANVSNTFTLPTSATTSLGGSGGLLRVAQSGQLSFDTTSYLTSNQSILLTSSGQKIEFGQNSLVVFDTDNTNTFKISFKGPNSLTKTSAFTLPEDGSSGQFLKTDGSGVLSFADKESGATGGGNDEVFFLSDTNVTEDFTIPSGKNAHTVSPIINSNKTVVVSAGSLLVIL